MQLEICLEKIIHIHIQKKNAEYKVHVQVIRKKDLRKIQISSNFFLQPFQFILYVLCYTDTNNVLKLSLNQEFSPA